MVTLKGAASAAAQDDAIMGTNNSSIVSKRSVERLYFHDEPHYFRYFVKKPQRRSPLINRGYWLRMKAVHHVVRRFLEQPSKLRKVVINLGCGYDPLAWQCLSRYPASCGNVSFVDVDYEDLMIKKRDTVQSTTELQKALTNIEVLAEGDILLRSDQYLQLGCDLRDLDRLDKALASIFDVQTCQILLVAEVSITYMDASYSNDLIRWASKLPHACFCLLEQLVPEGIGHPFAQTMMAHFEKLKTPLGAVEKYPTTHAQQQRFRSLGWADVSAQNLWSLFSSSDFLRSEERKALDQVEPFDEWEEFALFGCHYVLVVANTDTPPEAASKLPETADTPMDRLSSSLLVEVKFSESPKGYGCKRFASGLPLKSSDRALTTIGNFAGMGLQTRVDSMDVYSTASKSLQGPEPSKQKSPPSPSSRMCHTITDLGDLGSLLVGGRTAPDSAFKDCWLYHKWLDIWERVDDLPCPLYRHQATDVGEGRVLVSTGRINAREISLDWLIWSRRTGWMKCNADGDIPPPTYGTTLITFDVGLASDAFASNSARGIVAGGVSADAVLEQGIWEWELDQSGPRPTMHFRQSSMFRESQENQQCLTRFGANVVRHKNKTYILGGIVKDTMLSISQELCAIDMQGKFYSISRPSPDSSNPTPLLVGSTVVSMNDSLLIAGGSAVCFSFGTFWNQGCYTLFPASRSDASSAVFNFVQTVATLPRGTSASSSAAVSTETCVKTAVRRVRVTSSADFERILEAAVPVILEGLNVGPCQEKWTNDYLLKEVGPEREVIVHQSELSHMDFARKNFKYVTKPFGKFLESIAGHEKLYLRSLSSQNPTEVPSDIKHDYPTLSDDFHLPRELNFVSSNSHSSPLRISGPVTVWLHYDVMSNVLCQIRGEKRLLLFPPRDVLHLGFEPGASSSSINVFDSLQDPSMALTHPHEAILHPGDILFIPSLWPHSASPTSEISIAVNVFFRDLKCGYAVGKDVYGNRDLQAYEKGRQDISKIVKTFDKLPSTAQSFYLQRLVAEFQEKSLNTRLLENK